MSNLRQPIYVVLSVVAFLVLTVVATVEYSGDTNKSNDLKDQALYKAVSAVMQTTENVLSVPTAFNAGKIAADSQEDGGVSKQIHKYIEINKTESGVEIILQNTERVIFQKNLSFN